MSDGAVIGCVRVADYGYDVTIGSVQRTCADCGAAVWVAPSGVRVAEDKDGIFVCLRCMATRIKADPDRTIAPISSAQLAEAVATLLHKRSRN